MADEYCVYLTVYRGNRLPPFYIGHSTIKKIHAGYRGSVTSKVWKSTWDQELIENPGLFKTIIVTTHDTRDEALAREASFQRKLCVLKKPEMYVNKAIGVRFTRLGITGTKHRKFKEPRPQSYRDAVSARRKGSKMSEAQKHHLSEINKGKRLSDETRRKMSKASKGISKSPETKARMSAAQKGRTFSEETRKKMSIAAKNRKRKNG